MNACIVKRACFASIMFTLIFTPSLLAQPAPGLNAPPGFIVTEYADQTLANDIYCMTVDPRGRIVVAGRGYIRILVDEGSGRASRAIDFAAGPKDGAMGLLWEGTTLLAVGDGGVRRFTDADGDGKADGPSVLLRAVKTGGEHTAHALRRGPDGWLYLLCGNMAGIDKSYATLPTSPVKDPVAGCVVRFSPDFKQSEIVAHGFRNAYAMDFNADGELFTFDSDNERCVSLPWYEPTRFYHVVPGGFYGWLAPQRASFWRLPPYFIDVVPPVTTLGRGSPTGVVCYRQTQFPSEYQGGFFLCDWTFGKVYFVALTRKGAGYEAKTKAFLQSTGDNGFAPTAAVVQPKTGDLFIAIGGRGTRGAVYRIHYQKNGHAAAKNNRPQNVNALRSLENMRRFPERFSTEQRRQAVLDESATDDRLVHLACVNVLRDLLPALDAKEKQSWEAKITAPRSILTLAHAYAVIDPPRALTLLERIVAGEARSDICLASLRVLQMALGDIGVPAAKGTIWEGYTLRDTHLSKELIERGRRLALAIWQKAASNEQIDDAIYQEFARTAALLEMDHATFKRALDGHRPHVADSPPRRIHDLACLARMPGPRSSAETEAAATALLGLDELAVKGNWNRDSNWPLRIKELFRGLVEKDPNLPAAILRHPEFGRPDHVLFTDAKGLDRAKAAAVFLKRVAADKDYPLTPAIVALLGKLPAQETLPVLRPRYGKSGTDLALLPLLAEEPQPQDRPKFVAGLSANQPSVLRACLTGLAKLPIQDDGSEALALIHALGGVSDKQRTLRSAIEQRLTTLTGQSFGTNKKAWTDWFTKAHPDKAVRLTNPDGVDAHAWNRRLASLDWAKGESAAGKKVFAKASCVNCHSGSQAIGPDLAGVTSRFSRADLFTAIIQPSRDVSARYQTTVVETADGKVYQGLVIYDAVDSLILQIGPATTVRLAGQAVAARHVSALSLMPPGLLDPLSDREIAALYAYLKAKQAPGKTSAAAPKVTAIPEEIIKRYKLDTSFYKKHLDYKGFSILSSAKVSDEALLEARYLIDKLLGERPDILNALIKSGCRFMVMAPTEMTTDVPEQRRLKNDPKTNWDKRARGLGGRLSSCGAENLLNLKGDHYNQENILIHEFNHAIHQQALRRIDPTFQGRLKKAYDTAIAKGLWKGTYVATNPSEYWAEGAQAYFDCMRPQFGANTREKLKAYDPGLFALVDEVYRGSAYRYVRYDARPRLTQP